MIQQFERRGGVEQHPERCNISNHVGLIPQSGAGVVLLIRRSRGGTWIAGFDQRHRKAAWVVCARATGEPKSTSAICKSSVGGEAEVTTPRIENAAAVLARAATRITVLGDDGHSLFLIAPAGAASAHSRQGSGEMGSASLANTDARAGAG